MEKLQKILPTGRRKILKETGTMTIELSDAISGEMLQTVREQNIITNSTNDILLG